MNREFNIMYGVAEYAEDKETLRKLTQIKEHNFVRKFVEYAINTCDEFNWLSDLMNCRRYDDFLFYGRLESAVDSFYEREVA